MPCLSCLAVPLRCLLTRIFGGAQRQIKKQPENSLETIFERPSQQPPASPIHTTAGSRNIQSCRPRARPMAYMAESPPFFGSDESSLSDERLMHVRRLGTSALVVSCASSDTHVLACLLQEQLGGMIPQRANQMAAPTTPSRLPLRSPARRSPARQPRPAARTQVASSPSQIPAPVTSSRLSFAVSKRMLRL